MLKKELEERVKELEGLLEEEKNVEVVTEEDFVTGLEYFHQGELLDEACDLIDMAGGGNWDIESRSWKKKATLWRQRYSAHVKQEKEE